jgi:hypothetical protein
MVRVFLSIQEVPLRNKAMKRNMKHNLMKTKGLKKNLL